MDTWRLGGGFPYYTDGVGKPPCCKNAEFWSNCFDYRGMGTEVIECHSCGATFDSLAGSDWRDSYDE